MNAMYGIHGGLRQITPLVLMQSPFYGINADGFRGPAVSRAKPEGVVRLLFLGDSSTFGWPYGYRDIYPHLVGELLAERSGQPVEILDAGIPGQSIVQIRNKLARQLEFDPDVVLLMDGIHFEKTLAHLEDARQDPGPHDDHAFRLRFYPPVLPELLILGAVSHPLVTSCGGPTDTAALRTRGAENEQLAAEQLGGLADDLRSRGIPLILLEYPSRQVVPPARRQQQALALQDGVSWLPLLQLFPNDDSYSFCDGIHPDRDGHRRIAEAIVDDLLARSWPALQDAGKGRADGPAGEALPEKRAVQP